nr:DUF4123 domain-containing protein [Massilia sp. H27-R4]
MLLDCFGGNPLAEAIAAAEAPAAASLPLDDPMFEDDLGSAPLLIEILHDQPAHPPLLARSIELAHYQALNGTARSVCAWLFSDLPLVRLRSALRQRLDVRFPDGRIYFRYFDPRVMTRLAQILAPGAADMPAEPESSFSDVLGPVTIWCQLDRDGSFLRFDNPVPGRQGDRGHLRFGSDSAAAIERIAQVNMVVRALQQRALPCPRAQDGALDAHLVRARELGIADAEDQIAYAWRAQHAGTAFSTHSALQTIIGEAAANAIPLDAMFDARLPMPAIGTY